MVPILNIPKASSPEKNNDRELRTNARMKRKESVCKAVDGIIVLVTYNYLFTIVILGVEV